MNSETDKPTPPRRFNSRRNDTSVTPAIGESTRGGLISTSRILNGLISGITVYLMMVYHHGLIVIGVPTVTESNNSFMSSFSNATQPNVQSLFAPLPRSEEHTSE